MARLFHLALLFALFLSGPMRPVQATEASLRVIETPRGVKQSFILIKPEEPVATVILFLGGRGVLGLKSATKMKSGKNNFLVRSREKFAAQGLLVAVMDSPSDRPDKMTAKFRMGRAHAGDISAVVAYLKAEANIPVWLVGTSMGTFSVANGAIQAKGIDGLVLSSTVTKAPEGWWIAATHKDGVASMALGKIKVPTLIVAHRNDGCPITPPSGASLLTERLNRAANVETAIMDGGDPPVSSPCKALSQHGYYGIEDKVVETIARFIKSNTP